MRGQVSLEYLLIIGFLLFFVAVLTAYYKDFTLDTGSSVVVTASLDNFKRVADSVYALGPPATQNVSVIIPSTVNSSRTGFNSSVLQISYYDSKGKLVDNLRFFDYNLSGSFPSSPGTYEIALTALGIAGVKVS